MIDPELIKEFEELRERTMKMQSFLGSDAFKKLPILEQAQRQLQHRYMHLYANILKSRLSDFPIAVHFGELSEEMKSCENETH